jgi:hypothetical protein
MSAHVKNMLSVLQSRLGTEVDKIADRISKGQPLASDEEQAADDFDYTDADILSMMEMDAQLAGCDCGGQDAGCPVPGAKDKHDHAHHDHGKKKDEAVGAGEAKPEAEPSMLAALSSLQPAKAAPELVAGPDGEPTLLSAFQAMEGLEDLVDWDHVAGAEKAGASDTTAGDEEDDDASISDASLLQAFAGLAESGVSNEFALGPVRGRPRPTAQRAAAAPGAERRLRCSTWSASSPPRCREASRRPPSRRAAWRPAASRHRASLGSPVRSRGSGVRPSGASRASSRPRPSPRSPRLSCRSRHPAPGTSTGRPRRGGRRSRPHPGRGHSAVT